MFSQLYSGFLLGALGLLWSYRITLVNEQMSEAAGLTLAVCLLGLSVGASLTGALRKVPPAAGAAWTLLTLPILSAIGTNRLSEPAILTIEALSFLPFGALLSPWAGGRPADWAAFSLAGSAGAGCALLALPRIGAWGSQVIVALLFLLSLVPAVKRKLTPRQTESGDFKGGLELTFTALAVAVLVTGWERLTEIAAGPNWPALAAPAALLSATFLGASLGSVLSRHSEIDAWSVGGCQLGLALLGLVSWHGIMEGPLGALKFVAIALATGALLGHTLSRLQVQKAGLLGLGVLLGTLLATRWALPHWGTEITLQFGSSLAVLGFWTAGARAFGSGLSPSRVALILIGVASLPLIWLVPKAPTASEIRSAFHKDGLRASLRLGYTAPDSLALTLNGAQQLYAETGFVAGRKLLAYIPGFFQTGPKKAAVLGASLVTVTTLERDAGLEHVEWVAGDAYFRRALDYVPGREAPETTDSKTSIKTSSVRNFLQNSQSKYDIIVSESSLPWSSGVGYLTTQDYYREVLARLEDTGIFCQVCDLKAFSPNDLRSIARTFCSTFPQSQVWQFSQNTLAFVGAPKELKWHPEEVLRRWRGEAGVRQDMVAMNILEPSHLLGFRVAPSKVLLEQVEGARISTDDAPLLRLRNLVPAAFYESSTAWLKRLRGGGDHHRLGSAYAWLCVGDLDAVAGTLVDCPEGPPKAFFQCQLALLKKQDAKNQIEQALKAYSTDYRLQFVAALEAIERRSYAEAVAHLQICAAQTNQAPPIDKPASGDLGYAGSNGWEYPIYQALGACFEAQEKWQEASVAYGKAAEYSNLSSPLRSLGRCLLRQQNWKLAQHTLVRAVQRDANDYQSWSYLGEARIQLGQLDKAETALREALRLVPADHDARLKLVITLSQQNQSDKARTELHTLLKFHPGDPAASSLDGKL